MTNEPKIEGTCDAAFSGVKDAFMENFAEHDELGAAVAVYLDGQLVVDMWGGFRDSGRTQRWTKDTLACGFSISKAYVSVMGHMLADRGTLDLDQPVAHYWPAFAQAGKEDVTVRDIFTHRAALTYVDAALKPGDLYDWATMTRALEESARHAPFGQQPTYLNLTYGYLLGEVIRRIDGRTIGPFAREEITRPLNADFFFALKDAEIARCATIVPDPPPAGTATRTPPDPAAMNKSMQGLIDSDDRFNLDVWRKAQVGAGSGHGTARGVAKFFGCLANGGTLDRVRLITRETRDAAIVETGGGTDPINGATNRYGTGFLLNNPPGTPMGDNPRSFGHPGAGGRTGFADPDTKLGFAYLPNLMWGGPGLSPRGLRLIEAVYEAL